MKDIGTLVLQYQQDDDLNKRNEFIRSYMPFILKTVVKTTGYYVESESSDEWIVGLEAFNEAIDKYQLDKGSFVGYAAIVIRSRVIDFMRREWRYQEGVEMEAQVIDKAPMKVDEELAFELRVFKEQLSYFDICIEQLTEKSPKHKKTKRELTQLGKQIGKEDDLVNKLYETKRLPMAQIILRFGTTKKRLKCYRSYIISIIVAVKENLEQIQTYME